APFDEGPELEQLERAGARRPARGGPAHDGPEEAQGDLRQGPDHDPRERAAPLALLGGHDRLHAGDGEGFPPASDHVALRPGRRVARLISPAEYVTARSRLGHGTRLAPRGLACTPSLARAWLARLLLHGGPEMAPNPPGLARVVTYSTSLMR